MVKLLDVNAKHFRITNKYTSGDYLIKGFEVPWIPFAEDNWYYLYRLDNDDNEFFMTDSTLDMDEDEDKRVFELIKKEILYMPDIPRDKLPLFINTFYAPLVKKLLEKEY